MVVVVMVGFVCRVIGLKPGAFHCFRVRVLFLRLWRGLLRVGVDQLLERRLVDLRQSLFDQAVPLLEAREVVVFVADVVVAANTTITTSSRSGTVIGVENPHTALPGQHRCPRSFRAVSVVL